LILKTALFLSSLLLFYTTQLVSQTSITNKHPSGASTQFLSSDTAVINKNIETARNYINKGDYEQADIYVKLARKQAKAIKYDYALARTYNMEGNVLSRKGKYAEGCSLVDSALAIGIKRRTPYPCHFLICYWGTCNVIWENMRKVLIIT